MWLTFSLSPHPFLLFSMLLQQQKHYNQLSTAGSTPPQQFKKLITPLCASYMPLFLLENKTILTASCLHVSLTKFFTSVP